MIKAIETVYNGYRFRSRLEARWAVFFDALGIPYEYEKEGYDLDGVRYLPDFWLPELDCFFEIKGEIRTEDEWKKWDLLALHSGKDCHIAQNGCWIPTDNGTQIYGFEGVNAYARYINGHEEKLDMPRDLVVTLMKIYRWGIDVSITRLSGKGLYTSANNRWFGGYSFDATLKLIEQQRKELEPLFTTLDKRSDELHKLIPDTPVYKASGFTFSMCGGGSMTEMEWLACKVCKRVIIASREHLQDICDCEQIEIDEDRLIAAYTAARQARFEHGETPSLISPMTPYKILQMASNLGLHLSVVEGNNVRVVGPKKNFTDALRDYIRQYKLEIIELLNKGKVGEDE